MNKQPDCAVFVVDDDAPVREAIQSLVRSVDLHVESFASAQEFLCGKRPDVPSCLVLDIRLPGFRGLQLQRRLADAGIRIPIVFMTGLGDISMSVKANESRAVDFLTKPFRDQDLLDAIQQALENDRAARREQSLTDDLESSRYTGTAGTEAKAARRALVAIVDDDESIRDAISSLFRSMGYRTELFPDGMEFLASPHMREFSCVILDVHTREWTGWSCSAGWPRLRIRIPIIFVTAFGDENTRTRALHDGAVCFLPKPFSDDVLIEAPHSVIEV